MQIRIYYEDTDAGGVVYHSRYLHFLERARMEFLRERGICVRDLHDAGTIFPVVRAELDYRAPARLDDLVVVETSLERVGGSSLTFLQRVVREEDAVLLVDARITLACVCDTKARRLPPELREALEG